MRVDGPNIKGFLLKKPNIIEQVKTTKPKSRFQKLYQDFKRLIGCNRDEEKKKDDVQYCGVNRTASFIKKSGGN